jgi:signal transduction histidine kinase/DNA-binding NarL/FixJ family response regulator
MAATATKILLIEENPADVRLVRELLIDVGESLYDLVDVGLLSDGIRHLKDNGCDIVLLDFSLPDGMGIDMVTRLQSAVPEAPIVVLTGVDDDQMALDAMRAGAQDFLIKGSFDGPLLARALRYAIERKRAQQALARFQDQAALSSIAMTVSQSLQLDKLLEIVVAKVLEVAGCEMGHIRLRHPATGEMTLAAHQGLSPEHIDALMRLQRPAGKLAHVLKTGEIIVARGSQPVAVSGRMEKGAERLMVWIPLKAKGQVIGVLVAATAQRENFTERDLELLTAIGNVIGVGVENARLFTETRRQLERIEALRDIGVATASSLNLSRVLKILLEKITVMLPYSAVAIWLFDKASGELLATASWNLDDREWKASSGKGSRGLASAVFKKKSPIAIRDFLSDPRTTRPDMFRRQGLVSYLGLPMIANGEGVGVLSIYTKFEYEFSADEIRFLAALSNQAAMAIYNSQLYERLSKQASDLERSNKVKDEFLSVMSHEFRTPLNVILGYCGLMKDQSLGTISPEQELALDKIHDRSSDLLGMLSGILEVARIETEDVPVSCERFDLNDFIDNVRSAYRAKAKSAVELEWRAPSKGTAVTTDQQKLRLILEQLLTNAMQFTESGKITIAASRGADEGHVSLSVSDTGIGIPAESHDVIFEKFTQLDSSTTRAHEGIGLGLYLVRKFVDLLGGNVKVESEPGVGSRFEVTVPSRSDDSSVMAER